MSSPFKPIAISLLPNFSLGDFLAKDVSIPDNMTLFETGRVAQYFLLKGLGIGEGDEVIIQAFTCVAVPNSVAWTGAKPVFVDVDDTLNMDPEKMIRAITTKTRAVIWQSTFGNPGAMDKARKICQQKKICFIEDGAHTGRVTGDLGFISFGRDKAVSGLFGGGAIVSERKISIPDLPKKSYSLFYSLVVYFVLQTYSFFNLGKVIHKLLKNFLPKVLTLEEKQGIKPENFYQAPPKVLVQWNNRESFDRHRRLLADFYQQNLPGLYAPLRYSIFVSDPDGLRRFAAKRNIFLGDWYDSVVAPRGVNLEKIGYRAGSCPKAEAACKKIVNLPTNPNIGLEEARKVVEVVKLWELRR